MAAFRPEPNRAAYCEGHPTGAGSGGRQFLPLGGAAGMSITTASQEGRIDRYLSEWRNCRFSSLISTYFEPVPIRRICQLRIGRPAERLHPHQRKEAKE